MLNEAGVPADEVADVSKVLFDDQLEALGFWLETPVASDGNGGPMAMRLASLPVQIGHQRMPMRLPPPALEG